MKTLHLKLIHILQNSAVPCTASFLASQLDVSSRSVKNYIQEINSLIPDTIYSSHKGYSINNDNAILLLRKNKSSIPQTSNERVTYIINQIIKGNKIDTYDLCDSMFISYSTIKNELAKVKRKIKPYDLELVIENDTISIVGLEKSKRQLLSSMLYSESNTNFINPTTIAANFPTIEADFIRSIILETFDEYHYFVNDYSLANLILHITIAVDRIQNGYVNIEKFINSNIIKLHEHEMASKIVNKLEGEYGIKFNDGEVQELTLLLVSRATNLDYTSINENNLVDYIGLECYELVTELINDTSSYYYIDLSEQEFLVRFALHIKNLLVRCKSNYFSKNPLTESIKHSCPLIYDAAVALAIIIHKRQGVYINDDEIAYIAFHLGSALEIQKKLYSRIAIAIYSPNYYDMKTTLIEKINKHFEDDILINNIVTSEDEIKKAPCDLIISTLPLSFCASCPLIVINPFLLEKDIENITQKIKEIKISKKQKLFREHLKYLIIPEFFERFNSFNNQSELIHHMCSKLLNFDYVDENFEKQVIERDYISSTAFDSFAIPHALKMNAKKTGMNIIILENPLDWGEKKVNLIMMLCFNRNERYIFNELFEPLTMILTNKENLKEVLKANSYEEFIDILSSFINEP
ncbi:MAG: BglG family transcription antiterminator [Anaerorhabdus sp.]|uniref:BglG family transcription antiterminator n=1 Tax=Anaerorhabdus sp. TaxID=1872524 RepID=UPI003A83A02F